MKAKMVAIEFIFCILFSCTFFGDFSRKIIFDKINYIEIENLVGEAGGLNCNFYVEGLKLQELDGFMELDRGHYVANSAGAKIRFKVENMSNVRINAVILEPAGSMLRIRGWQDSNISLYSETIKNEYIDLSNGKIELFGMVHVVISLFLFMAVQAVKKIEKKKIFLWGTFLGMGLVFYGYNFQNSHGCDDIPTYLLVGQGLEKTLKTSTFLTYTQTLGRPVAGILFLIFGEIFSVCSSSAQAVFNQQLLALFVIVLLAFCAYIMYKIVDFILGGDTYWKKILSIIACCCFLYNPFFTDLMYYKGANLFFSFSILFNLLAARIFVENKGEVFNQKGIYIFFWTILGAFTYQPMGAYFVIFALLSISAQGLRGVYRGRDIFRKGFICLCLYGSSYLLNLIYVNFVGSVQEARIPKFDIRILMQTLQVAWNWLKEFWITGAGYMRPKYFLVISVFFLVIITALCVFRKKKVIQSMGICFLFLTISYCIIFYFNLFTKDLWSINARTSTAFGGFPALELILMAIIGEEMEKSEIVKKVFKFAVIFGVMLCCVYYIDILENANKISITSAEDAFLGQFYADRIKRYETETGNIITKVGFTEDAAVTCWYRYGFEQTECSPFWRCTYISWSRNRLIEIFLDYRSLEVIDVPDEIYNSVFAGENWDCLSDEQMFFEEDTVYICMY